MREDYELSCGRQSDTIENPHPKLWNRVIPPAEKIAIMLYDKRGAVDCAYIVDNVPGTRYEFRDGNGPLKLSVTVGDTPGKPETEKP